MESEGTSPLPKGLLFLHPGLADRAAQVVEEGAKERKQRKKKGNEKISGSSILCHKGWAGGAQAQLRRRPLHMEGQHEEG